tara:strand:- start:61 stop:357 length:297 start_codon:yes stop_codon:yes gene_type:complete
MGLFLFLEAINMVTKQSKLDEARDLVDKAQQEDDIFGKTYSAMSYWADKYGDYRSAWFHGVLYHLETWLELAEVSTVVRTCTPEMPTAIGEFLDRMMD